MVTCPYRHRTKWSVWLDGPGLTQLLEAWQEVGFLEVLFQFSFASLVQKTNEKGTNVFWQLLSVMFSTQLHRTAFF